MAPCVPIFQRKFDRLLAQPGGKQKATEWFLSGDQNFANLTAERFALDFLGATLPTLEDRLLGVGPDGVLHDPDGDVGIEVTTLNGFVGLWVFMERLPIELDEAGHSVGLEILYSIERLALEAKGDMSRYIQAAATAIVENDHEAANQLDLGFTARPQSGCIVWTHEAPVTPADPDYPTLDWLKIITDDVREKLLAPRKRKQLSRNSRNVVIIGVNNSMPTLYPFPDVFENLAGIEADHHGRIPQVKAFWDTAFASIPELTAVGYYTYSIDREDPFYPFRLIVRDDARPVPGLISPSS